MSHYEIRTLLDNTFELPDDEEIVSADIGAGDHHQTQLLVKVPDPDEEYVCGAETSSGECTRSVDGPEQYCWQHE